MSGSAVGTALCRSIAHRSVSAVCASRKLDACRTQTVTQLLAAVESADGLSARQRNRAKRLAKSGAATAAGAPHPPATVADAPSAGGGDEADNTHRLAFDSLYDELLFRLFDEVWQRRHGAAIGLRAVLRARPVALQSVGSGLVARSSEDGGATPLFLQDCCLRCLCVLALDRCVAWGLVSVFPCLRMCAVCGAPVPVRCCVVVCQCVVVVA